MFPRRRVTQDTPSVGSARISCPVPPDLSQAVPNLSHWGPAVPRRWVIRHGPTGADLRRQAFSPLGPRWTFRRSDSSTWCWTTTCVTIRGGANDAVGDDGWWWRAPGVWVVVGDGRVITSGWRNGPPRSLAGREGRSLVS